MSKFNNIYSMVVDRIKKWQEEIKPKFENIDKKQDQLLSTLEKTKNDYISRTTSGDNLSVDFKRMTDNDLKNIATKILSEDYEDKKNSITNDYDTTVKKLEDNLQQKQSNVASQINKVEQVADKDKNQTMNKAMKNNIARSSSTQLQKEKIDEQAESQKNALNKELDDTEKYTAKKIDSATKLKDDKLQRVEEEYDANLTAKENELKNYKESDSPYVDSFVDKREAQKFSDDLVKIVMEFAKSVPNGYASYLLDENSKIKEILTQDEIDYIKKMLK